MTTKAKPKGDPVKDAALAAATPAAFARAIDKDGKAVRTVLRGRFGAYVSKGVAFDVPLRTALYAHIVEGDKDAAQTWRDAH